MITYRRKVLIYGDSLFLKGIAVTLHARTDFDVIEARSALPANLEPDILLVDAAHTSLEEAESLLETYPHTHTLKLVRLDAAGQSLTVHSIHSLPAVYCVDLTQVIEHIFNDA